MAALLVAMSIMAVMMTVVMPVWKQAARREKEEELVFRGLQYVHAIGLFQRKFANAYPPNIDVLVEQRFLRKKFKDPITNEDFVVLPVGQGTPGTAQPGQQGQRGQTGATGGRGPATSAFGTPQTAQPATGRGTSPIGAGIGGSTGAGGTTAGVSGVTSKSKDQSIRLYKGRSHYNEWVFVYTPQVQPGAGAPGSTTPGQIPGQRGQPGQPNQPGPFNPSNPRGRGGFGTPGGPGTQTPPGGRGFGPGQTPVQPPNFPRGRG